MLQLCFSSGDVEEAGDSTDSHTRTALQPDPPLLAQVPHQSQGQRRAQVPGFYSDKWPDPTRLTP